MLTYHVYLEERQLLFSEHCVKEESNCRQLHRFVVLNKKLHKKFWFVTVWTPEEYGMYSILKINVCMSV